MRDNETAERTASRTREIREPEFADRLQKAMDGNPLVPPGYGRGAWLLRELKLHFPGDGEISSETMRRWLNGEVKPRPDKVRMLATVLKQNEAWLSLGIDSDLPPRELKARNAMAEGVVNLVAGLIQMHGGHPAFPEDDDKRAARNGVDLYAIVKGAQYALHISRGEAAPGHAGAFKFVVPPRYEDAFQIGVIEDGDLAFRLVEIPADLIEVGRRHGGSIEVVMLPAQIERAQIRNFRERL